MTSKPAAESQVPCPQTVGRVLLVGAGPGDPGLLTLRGAECLRQADLVLYDGLVNPLLLRHSHADSERTCRVDGPTGRHIPQEEINRRLIEAARAGKTVVRLKGGDPFIFGRGSEEAAALREAGIPFEVVPGITAATAAAVYSGISLTHREYASAVAFVTAHEDPAKTSSMLDYRSLAQFSGTLVFYMGLHRLESIVKALVEAGKPETTAACVVSRATQPLQRTVTGTLANIAQLARASDLHAPSLVIIGECVKIREQAGWFEDRPLFGKVIGITRPEDQGEETMLRAVELGALPIPMPTIEIAPPADWAAVDAVLSRLEEFDWIVWTSVNGVRGLLERLWKSGGDVRRLSRARLACIGPATANVLQEFSLRPDLVAPEYRAESLAESLIPHVYQKKVLWARASRGREVLTNELRKASALLEEVVVYQNTDASALPHDAIQRLERGELDWIGLSSPTIARSLAHLLTPAAREHLNERTRIACISPVTESAAREAGLPVSAVATTYTWEGMFQAIIAAEKATV